MDCQENIVNLELIKGDTKTFTITVTSDGVVIDITDYILFFTVKTSVNDSDEDAIISKTVVCPDNTASEAGIGMIALDHDDTNVAVGTYTYDIKLQKNISGGIISWRKTLVTGKFKVNLTATTRTS